MELLHVSHPSKLHCPSIGFPAGLSCPGSKARIEKHGIRSVCRTCYAKTGACRSGTVRGPLARNFELARERRFLASDDLAELFFASIMGEGDRHPKYFRWMWSGDVWSPNVAAAIVQVARWFMPGTAFWVPTKEPRMFKGLRIPANLTVRPSAARIGDAAPRVRGLAAGCTTVLPGDRLAGHFVCPGDCSECRVCWDSPQIAVAYPWHGDAIVRRQARNAGLEV